MMWLQLHAHLHVHQSRLLCVALFSVLGTYKSHCIFVRVLHSMSMRGLILYSWHIQSLLYICESLALDSFMKSTRLIYALQFHLVALLISRCIIFGSTEASHQFARYTPPDFVLCFHVYHMPVTIRC